MTPSSDVTDLDIDRVVRLGEEIVHAEGAGQPLTDDLWDDFEGACEAARVPALVHLSWLRGGRPAPFGVHGPFPGERCVYCGANYFDVAIYTVDSRQCPPAWSCGATHADDRVAFCQLPSGHGPDQQHAYTYAVHPQAPSGADSALAQGPELQRTLRW